ncbi:SUMF1/EgtB/PvdO family nonheme iron enzyme [Nonomuraea sp. B1E8]|uniref:SUMF1/EgtB/PvdO family nonheme iron enzyme n=1 Tax=unclassified Nonomuraea TaxID=2593643 RepID=UPI00325E884C
MGLVTGMEFPSGETVVEVRHGGFAEVGVCEDGFGGMKVVKRIKDEVLARAGEAVLEAFFQECQIWVHRLGGAPPEAHIARAHYALRRLDDLGPVLYLSYVDGPPLGDLTRQGRQSLSQTVRMGAQIASAIAYAHERDVRHRDLKPNNILLTSGNEIQLIDWGLVRAQHATELTAGVVDYWSPQRRADPLLDDPGDDIYALGVILHECLTGRYPRERAALAHLRSDLTAAQPTAPAHVLDLVCRMLAPSPAERPAACDVKAVLGAADLRADVLAREAEHAFCRSCGYVAGEPATTCPVCESQMYERYATPPREGMVRVPPGVFVHGLSENQARQALMAAGIDAGTQNLRMLAPLDDPPRNVFVPGFDIDITPVTNQAYAEFVEATNYPAPPDLLAACATMPDHPVVQITWRDALCYALWAGKRLPRPLEWEKAARGDKDDRTYPWGDVWQEDLCNHHRYPSNDFRTTSPVTTFAGGQYDGRSPYGVADLAGNVSEWVSHSRATQAKGRDAETRAVCGGGWSDPVAAFGAVSAQRAAEIDYKSESVGFRCAADISYEERPVSWHGPEAGSAHSPVGYQAPSLPQEHPQ